MDRSFVQRMATDARDAAIVRSVVDLGVGLGMRVVAEGVEDRATWRLLADMGCDEAQGWLLSPAEPAHVLTPWLPATGSDAHAERAAASGAERGRRCQALSADAATVAVMPAR